MSNYKLCAGTFFNLLLQAKANTVSAREKLGAKSDGKSNSHIYVGLINITDDSFSYPEKESGRSFTTIVSNLKTCKTSNNSRSVYLPMLKDAFISSFHSTVNDNYQYLLTRTASFVDQYLNPENLRWLANAVLQLIRQDDSIDDNNIFHVTPDGSQRTKFEIVNIKKVCLESLLAGVWYYIVSNKIDNSTGQITLKTWGTIGQYAKNISKEFEIYRSNKSKSEVSNTHIAEVPELDIFNEYLQRMTETFSYVKLLIYREQKIGFKQCYVCNDLRYSIRLRNGEVEYIDITNATIEKLKAASQFCLITANGGIGKSMLLQHLLLDTISTYDSNNQLPLFIPLKDYSNKFASLLDFAYYQFSNHCDDISIQRFIILLRQGKFVILLDGLDELTEQATLSFEKEFNDFSERYSKCFFVMSSRPNGNFGCYRKFSQIFLRPFNKLQAIQMVKKLKYKSGTGLTESFIARIDKDLYFSHREFVENPLLCSMMLLTYEKFAEIPSKMHLFYQKVFTTLAEEHDANKGSFKREYLSGLSVERLGEYFQEFCLLTYYRQKLNFTYNDVVNIYSKMKYPQKENVPTKKFIKDITNNLCLLYYEGQEYRFIHRSFQEYFAALFISRQLEEDIYSIVTELLDRVQRSSDTTFDMLYDMIPEKMQLCVFLPYLKEFFSKYKGFSAYYKFLSNEISCIEISTGETCIGINNGPRSKMLNLIINKANIRIDLNNVNIYNPEAYLRTEYCLMEEADSDPYFRGHYDSYDPIAYDEVPGEYIEKYGKPEICGQYYEIYLSELVDNYKSYRNDDDREIIVELLSKSCCFYKLFKALKDYYQKLLALEKQNKSTGFFARYN